MNFKIILFIILGFFIFNNLSYSHAQMHTVEWEGDDMPDTSRRSNPDSVKAARTHIADSIKLAHERLTDSTKQARKQKSDSLQSTRKHKADSAAAIRKYHDSKHYKDSVTRYRTAISKSVKTSRQAHMDSVKDARQKTTDSLASSRKSKTDSIKTLQKKRTDSLEAKKKYKASKRYTDSVAIRKHEHTDSIKNAQKASRDRMASVRKHSLDSAKTIRKHTMDSVKVVRTKHLDSIKLVRKTKTDSLAKVKADKEKLAKAKEKKKQQALSLKLELKMKQKHEAWSNKSMLKKRWSPVRRVAQNSFTHYNYYYNANKKMDEALINMQRSRKENFDSLIGLYPFDPNKDSSLLMGDMDSIVRKVSVGIQIHDPRVKWSNDMYLILGEAYYYKGSYENASIAFRYIISSDEEARKMKVAKSSSGNSKAPGEAPSILEDDKTSRLNFLKHKSVHNEAILWLARTYTEAHQPENAESILSLLESDANLPDELKGRMAIEKAFAYLTENNLPEASKQLTIAVDDENLPNWLRLRVAFLNGQIMQNNGEYKNAALSFEKVISYYPKIEMDFYSRKYIAFNRLMAGEDADDAMRPLKNILHDGKYINYYDQVYFVLGQLALKANKTDEAITYFTKSAATPKATKKQKALSFTALGNVYYSNSQYASAKRSYDSAAKYSSSASKDKTVIAATQRSKGLEEIAGPTRVIYEQDSLMQLASRTNKEQQAAVRRYLRYLEQRREDSIRNAEAAGVTAAAPAEADADKANTDAANWYFGNTVLMQQGSEDFKRKWGNRPLTDNWRRALGGSEFAHSSGGQDDNEADAVKEGADENGLPTEATLMAKIPNTPQQKTLSAKMEQRAYMLLAKAYMKQLEDYNMAIHTLDTLDVRFPNHNQKEEELYLRYQIAVKQNKLDKAQGYAQELLAKFPDSQYANNLRPKQSESRDDANANKTAGAYFDETYNLLLQHQYTEALMRIDVGKKQYSGNPVYKKRFEVAEAMGNAGMGDYDKADTIITHFLAANPADTLTAWATTVKQYIKEVRNGGKPSWYYDTIPVSKSVAAKTAAQAVTPKITPPPSNIPAMYSYSPNSEHYCIIVTPGVESRSAGLKYKISKFNSGTDTTANLNILFDLYSIDQGVFLIKKFKNAEYAKAYMERILASPALNDYKPGELQVYIITSVNYLKMFSDKNAVPYTSFYSAYYK